MPTFGSFVKGYVGLVVLFFLMVLLFVADIPTGLRVMIIMGVFGFIGVMVARRFIVRGGRGREGAVTSSGSGPSFYPSASQRQPLLKKLTPEGRIVGPGPNAVLAAGARTLERGLETVARGSLPEGPVAAGGGAAGFGRVGKRAESLERKRTAPMGTLESAAETARKGATGMFVPLRGDHTSRTGGRGRVDEARDSEDTGFWGTLAAGAAAAATGLFASAAPRPEAAGRLEEVDRDDGEEDDVGPDAGHGERGLEEREIVREEKVEVRGKTEVATTVSGRGGAVEQREGDVVVMKKTKDGVSVSAVIRLPRGVKWSDIPEGDQKKIQQQAQAQALREYRQSKAEMEREVKGRGAAALLGEEATQQVARDMQEKLSRAAEDATKGLKDGETVRLQSGGVSLETGKATVKDFTALVEVDYTPPSQEEDTEAFERDTREAERELEGAKAKVDAFSADESGFKGLLRLASEPKKKEYQAAKDSLDRTRREGLAQAEEGADGRIQKDYERRLKEAESEAPTLESIKGLTKEQLADLFERKGGGPDAREAAKRLAEGLFPSVLLYNKQYEEAKKEVLNGARRELKPGEAKSVGEAAMRGIHPFLLQRITKKVEVSEERKKQLRATARGEEKRRQEAEKRKVEAAHRKGLEALIARMKKEIKGGMKAREVKKTYRQTASNIQATVSGVQAQVTAQVQAQAQAQAQVQAQAQTQTQVQAQTQAQAQAQAQVQAQAQAQTQAELDTEAEVQANVLGSGVPFNRLPPRAQARIRKIIKEREEKKNK